MKKHSSKYFFITMLPTIVSSHPYLLTTEKWEHRVAIWLPHIYLQSDFIFDTNNLIKCLRIFVKVTIRRWI